MHPGKSQGNFLFNMKGTRKVIHDHEICKIKCDNKINIASKERTWMTSTQPQSSINWNLKRSIIFKQAELKRFDK